MANNTLLEDATLQFWDGFIAGAKVTIDGVESDYPIFKTLIEGKRLKKFVYLQTEMGLLTHARLVDAQGREVRAKDMNIRKNEDGLMVTFFLSIRIEEGVNV